jgi:hypothetical protein
VNKVGKPSSYGQVKSGLLASIFSLPESHRQKHRSDDKVNHKFKQSINMDALQITSSMMPPEKLPS